jgi:ribonuclease VapC
VNEIVLDASALLAALLGESGGDEVGQRFADAAMTTVNFSEVASYYARMGSSEGDIRALLTPLPIARFDFDEDLAYRAAILLPMTRPAGLSLGDRACLALAQRLNVPALTADRNWLQVAPAVGVTIDLIR